YAYRSPAVASSTVVSHTPEAVGLTSTARSGRPRRLNHRRTRFAPGAQRRKRTPSRTGIAPNRGWYGVLLRDVATRRVTATPTALQAGSLPSRADCPARS